MDSIYSKPNLISSNLRNNSGSNLITIAEVRSIRINEDNRRCRDYDIMRDRGT